MTAVWPELVEVEVRGNRARRRDLIDMDPEHLAGEIEAAWPVYIATFWKRNASIGLAMWDRDDIEAELRLLLTESAGAFDPSKGRGSFPAWAASQLPRLGCVAAAPPAHRPCPRADGSQAVRPVDAAFPRRATDRR